VGGEIKLLEMGRNLPVEPDEVSALRAFLLIRVEFGSTG
jgi:hypothetical protein